MAAESDGVMTIGSLSRRCGVPVKTLRTYEDLGLIYTVGRSEGNYRLFGSEALWCVQVTETMRHMGLTLAEIGALLRDYQAPSSAPMGPRLERVLAAVRLRTEQRIADLQLRLEMIRQFETQFAGELAGTSDFGATDPRRGAGTLDSPSTGRP
ncbi:MAG: MerR family transcriptional regulator [Candidatus Dormibacteria bacterium]